MRQSIAASSGPIEAKVTSSTLTATGLGILLAILNSIDDNPNMIGSLPVWLQSLILAVIPGLAVFISGYATSHTPRPDVTGGSPNLS